jgi:E3 ubiquitin-protein ligase DOA10
VTIPLVPNPYSENNFDHNNFQKNNEEESGRIICRNCHDTDGDDFIAPCNCKGSIKFVHRKCLDEWRL